MNEFILLEFDVTAYWNYVRLFRGKCLRHFKCLLKTIAKEIQREMH